MIAGRPRLGQTHALDESRYLRRPCSPLRSIWCLKSGKGWCRRWRTLADSFPRGRCFSRRMVRESHRVGTDGSQPAGGMAEAGDDRAVRGGKNGIPRRGVEPLRPGPESHWTKRSVAASASPISTATATSVHPTYSPSSPTGAVSVRMGRRQLFAVRLLL